jgi:plastocyanin
MTATCLARRARHRLPPLRVRRGGRTSPRSVALGIVLALLAVATPASAQDGVQTLHYKYGPITISPGQNTIELEANTLKPPVDGWITGFRPNLVRKDGTVPRVDVIHLHHGVWLKNYQPLFAAGEEKTTFKAPPGYGWRYRTTDTWHMNHMIHNLTPTPEKVYITYDLDFVPDGSPAAAGMNEVDTVWLDTVGGAYPVFDAKRGTGGKDRQFTYPDEAPAAPRRNTWTVPEDGAIVGTAGHLHPGGLWTDLTLTRDGRSIRLFRSKAVYYEPAGAVSWDVSMTTTPPTWRVGLRKGDVLSVSGTYDTKRASWYESMAIMPTMFDPGGTGADPFVTNVDVEGAVTHGHLPENDSHGGGRFAGLPDPRGLLARPVPSGGGTVAIRDFVYGQGDLSSTGRRGRPARVRRGRGLTFVNRDAKATIYHTITACRAPCNRTTGIAYPLADGKVDFDSGELGFGPEGFTPAANRDRWTTPKGLKAGTYTYFCRVHPFMRGAFKVKRGR